MYHLSLRTIMCTFMKPGALNYNVYDCFQRKTNFTRHSKEHLLRPSHRYFTHVSQNASVTG